MAPRPGPPSIGLLSVLLAVAAGCGAGVGSIGAVLGRDDDTHAVFIRDVPPGLASDQAGLLPGDEILMIDGIYVRDLTSQGIRARLRGDVGTKVELTVVRGSEVLRVQVVRRELRERDGIAPREERIEP